MLDLSQQCHLGVVVAFGQLCYQELQALPATLSKVGQAMATETADGPGVGSRKSWLAAGTVAVVSDCIEAGRAKATEVGDEPRVRFGSG